MQPASRTPLLLRQIPVWENGVATGFVDLALERAFVYRESAPSEVIEMPAGVVQEEKHARYSMLEKLADYDDALMEQLLSDIEPPKDLVFDDLARELREGHVVPVLMGSATEGHGVTRLLKAVRHEAPAIAPHPQAPRRRRRRPGARPGHPHRPHRARRQAVAVARAARRLRRRRDGRSIRTASRSASAASRA